jgi:superfamily I DNA/RNA helicase
MLDNHPRHQLRFIIEKYGRSAIRDSNRCRELLRELAPEHLLEINLLILVLTEGFVSVLTAENLESLAQRLHNEFGIQPEFAFWAVESWALALDAIQPPIVQEIITSDCVLIKPASKKIGKFIVQGGTATDTETGLMWLRFAHGQQWENGTVAGNSQTLNWHDAIKIPDTFNQQGYSGYNDWRVPTITELELLIDQIKGKKGNYIDVDVFPKNAQSFWSSSTYAANSYNAWYVLFNNGYSSNSGKNYLKYVRLVRSINVIEFESIVIQEPKSFFEKESSQIIETFEALVNPIKITTEPQKIGKFIVQGGTATDTETGLMWLRFSYGQKFENGNIEGEAQEVIWKDAMKIPQEFNQQGFADCNDWRVPTIEELKTLIDKVTGKEGNYIDTDIFPKNTLLFWSSSPSSGYSDSACSVGFYYGLSYNYYKGSKSSVRLVCSTPKLLDIIKHESTVIQEPAVFIEKVPSQITERNVRLTDEQKTAVALAYAGHNLKIEALAGTGKTSTLCEIAKALAPRRGLYLAFNKSIADEAKSRFPLNVDCGTAHRLAFHASGRPYQKRFGNITGKKAAQALNLKEGILGFSVNKTGGIAIETLMRFMRSADEKLTEKHVPKDLLISLESDKDKKAMCIYAAQYANQLWGKMCDTNSSLPVPHDLYMKLWSLKKTKLNVSFILFDEAQDADPVMLSVIQAQTCQKIYVGDSYQQIYSWRGAVNAMNTIHTEKTTTLCQSFRFGHVIADVANAILDLPKNLKLLGFSSVDSILTKLETPRAIICRTNFGLVEQVIIAIEEKRSVYVNGGTKDLVALLRGAEDLLAGKETYVRELAIFSSWDEVVEHSETEYGAELKPLVKLVYSYGKNLNSLITLLERTQQSEKDADLIVTTAHKAKGREWSSVKLNNDFLDERSPRYSLEERNLLYVAATRAKQQLDGLTCEAFQSSIRCISFGDESIENAPDDGTRFAACVGVDF